MCVLQDGFSMCPRKWPQSEISVCVFVCGIHGSPDPRWGTASWWTWKITKPGEDGILGKDPEWRLLSAQIRFLPPLAFGVCVEKRCSSESVSRAAVNYVSVRPQRRSDLSRAPAWAEFMQILIRRHPPAALHPTPPPTYNLDNLFQMPRICQPSYHTSGM